MTNSNSKPISNTSKFNKELSQLAYSFNLDDDLSLPDSLFERVVSKALIQLGSSTVNLNRPQPHFSIRDYLDSNSIIYRQVVTPHSLTKNEHPMLIVSSSDGSDLYCSTSHRKNNQVYSAYNNSFVNEEELIELSPTSYEVYASLPDDRISLYELFSYTFLDQLWPIARLLLAAFFGTVLYLLLPLFTDTLINSILPSREVTLLITSTVGFLLILSVSSAITFLQNLILVRLETSTDLRLQVALWDRLIKLPLEMINKYTTADLNSRVEAVTKIRRILTSAVLQTVLSSLFSIIYIVIMLIFDPMATFMLLILTAFLILILVFVSYLKFRIQTTVFQVEADTLNFSLQSLQNLIPFKSAGFEPALLIEWLRKLQALAKLNLMSKSYEDTMVYVTQFFKTFTISLLFIYIYYKLISYPSAYLNLHLTSLAATYLTFLLAYQALIEGITILTKVAGTVMSEVYVQWNRAKPIFNATLDPGYRKENAHHVAKEKIHLDSISYTYLNSSQPIFQNLSMSFEIGKFTAITGQSGCGKSTLIKLLLGLVAPQSGSIYIDNIPIQKINIRTYRRSIGVVMQDVQLFSGSIYKNICCGLDFDEDQVWEALRKAQVADEINAMPMKLQTNIMDSTSSFSGGQVQRLTIARALINNPTILIMDEATSALDPTQQSKLIDMTNDLGITLITVAHRLSTIANADITYVIEGKKAHVKS